MKTKSQPSDACLVTVDKTECRLKAAAVKARQNTLKEIWHLMMSIDRSLQAVIDCKGFLSNIEKNNLYLKNIFFLISTEPRN